MKPFGAEASAIIAEYEELWRQAALSGRAHMSAGDVDYKRGRRLDPGGIFEGDGDDSRCAASIHNGIREGQRGEHAKWDLLCGINAPSCPECGRDMFSVACLMTHLNDVHRWTWLDFANKFRALITPPTPSAPGNESATAETADSATGTAGRGAEEAGGETR